MSNNWFDFNDAQNPIVIAEDPEINSAEIKSRLIDRLPSVLDHLFPAGKISGKKFIIGNVHGKKGNSLEVQLEGENAGLWHDFATSEGGDVFDLWARASNLDTKRDFPTLMDSISRWLGAAPVKAQIPKKKKQQPIDELGAHSDKWDYRDPEGKLVACVYRYDTPEGKEFRPWDVKAKKYQAPMPRPLYNLPAVASSNEIIYVEGEKCADALNSVNYVATTAMHGANAPADKTDWSHLSGKDILIWPDNDEAGRKHANEVAHAMKQAGVKSVYILEIPDDKPPKWDAADAVEEGLDIARFIKGANKNKPKSPIASIDPVSDWVGKPPRREWIIPDWLPKGYVTALYGDGGVGKSLLAQQLITSLATGTPWLTLPVNQHRVYALMCEDDSNELWRRQEDINMDADHSMEDLTSLRLVSRVGENNLLMTFDGQDEGKLTPFFHELLQDILDFEADVIILDTLADLFAGNENNRSQARQFIQNACARIARESGGAVLLCAHPSDSGMSKGTGTGGSTAWSNTVRSRWYLTHNRSDDAQPHQRLLSRKKSNYSASSDCIDLVWRFGVLKRIYVDRNENECHTPAEKKRKEKQKVTKSAIIKIIKDEASHGRLYTSAQFAQAFENHEPLCSDRRIRELIQSLSTKQEIVFTQDGERYGLDNLTKGHGYLCLPEMQFLIKKPENNFHGELIDVIPTHQINPANGKIAEYSDSEDEC